MLIIEAVQGFFGERFLPFFLGITYLGGEAVYIVLLSLYYWLINPRWGRQLGLILTLSIISNLLIKEALALPRPYVLNPELSTLVSQATGEGYRFPSGHAQGTATFWGMLACLHRQGWLWGLAIFMIISVSFSRIYLGVHLPIDVIGGIVLGGIWVAIGKTIMNHETLPYLHARAKIALWLLGAGGAWLLPEVASLLGIFCGFFPANPSTFAPPRQRRHKFILAIAGLSLVTFCFLTLKGISLRLPENAVIDYIRYLAIAQLVSQGVPWLWQRSQRLR